MNVIQFSAKGYTASGYLSSDTIATLVIAFAAGSLKQRLVAFPDDEDDQPVIRMMSTVEITTPFTVGNNHELITKNRFSIFGVTQYDSTANKSNLVYELPYPVKGCLVALVSNSEFPSTGISQDVGNFISINIGGYVGNVDGEKPVWLHLALCKSNLTDAYTPFSTYFSGGSYAGSNIAFFNLRDIMNAANIHTDAILQDAFGTQCSLSPNASGFSTGRTGIGQVAGVVPAVLTPAQMQQIVANQISSGGNVIGRVAGFE